MEASVLLWIAQAVLGAFAAVLWFLFQDVKSKAEKATNDLAEFKTIVAQVYVSHTALKDTLGDIKEMFRDYETKMDQRLNRIEDKLDEVRSKQ
jgi:predicted  nucleic acid-binding Zn-ribbon protein